MTEKRRTKTFEKMRLTQLVREEYLVPEVACRHPSHRKTAIVVNASNRLDMLHVDPLLVSAFSALIK